MYLSLPTSQGGKTSGGKTPATTVGAMGNGCGDRKVYRPTLKRKRRGGLCWSVTPSASGSMMLSNLLESGVGRGANGGDGRERGEMRRREAFMDIGGEGCVLLSVPPQDEHLSGVTSPAVFHPHFGSLCRQPHLLHSPPSPAVGLRSPSHASWPTRGVQLENTWLRRVTAMT